jgi:hypothetical protein
MPAEKTFTKEELGCAAARAIQELHREIATRQLKGLAAHPHTLANLDSWMKSVFTDTTPKHGVLPLENYLTAFFGNPNPTDEVTSAFAYGLHAGFGELGVQMPERAEFLKTLKAEKASQQR